MEAPAFDPFAVRLPWYLPIIRPAVVLTSIVEPARWRLLRLGAHPAVPVRIVEDQSCDVFDGNYGTRAELGAY